MLTAHVKDTWWQEPFIFRFFNGSSVLYSPFSSLCSFPPPFRLLSSILSCSIYCPQHHHGWLLLFICYVPDTVLRTLQVPFNPHDHPMKWIPCVIHELLTVALSMSPLLSAGSQMASGCSLANQARSYKSGLFSGYQFTWLSLCSLQQLALPSCSWCLLDIPWSGRLCLNPLEGSSLPRYKLIWHLLFAWHRSNHLQV